MHDPDETPCDCDETPFDGGCEIRRIGAALDGIDARLADPGTRLYPLEAVLDRLNGRLDRTIRTMRRLFSLLVLGLTAELSLSVWILWRSHARTCSSGGDHETSASAIGEFPRLSDDYP